MKKLLVTSVILGIAFASTGLNSSSVLAATLSCNGSKPRIGSLLRDQGTDQTTFTTNCGATSMGMVQGRPGVLGSGDYEIAIGPNGAQADRTGQMQLTWLDNITYNWQLDWNPTTNLATFKLTDSTGNPSPTFMTYTFSGNLDKFNAFGIMARADDPSARIDLGTTMNISVNSITTVNSTGNSPTTDSSINLGVTATSTIGPADNFQKHFYTLNTLSREISQLKGTFKVNWNTINPQQQRARSAGFGFYVQLFDPQITATVPESSSIMGLLAVGFLGLGGLLKGKKEFDRKDDK